MFLHSILAAFLMVSGVLASLIMLNHKKQLACKVVKLVAWFLLIYKLTYYFIHIVIMREGVLAIPVEMSAVMYFLFPIAILTKNKILKEFGVIGAFLSGFLQLITVIPMPYVYLIDNTYASLAETIVLHFLLFIGGFIYITRIEEVKIKNVWKFIMGLMVMTCWSQLANTTFLVNKTKYPPNVMFLQRSVFPFSIFKGNFFWDYLFVLIVLLAFTYSTSHMAMRKQDHHEPGIFA